MQLTKQFMSLIQCEASKHKTAVLTSSTYLTSAKKLEGTRRIWATSSISCFPFSGLRGLEKKKRNSITKAEHQVLRRDSQIMATFCYQTWSVLGTDCSPTCALIQGPAALPALGWGLLIPNSTLLWEMFLPPGRCSVTLTNPLALGCVLFPYAFQLWDGSQSMTHLGAAITGCLPRTGSLTYALLWGN